MRWGSVALDAAGARVLVGLPWSVHARSGDSWTEEAVLPSPGNHDFATLSSDGSRAVVTSEWAPVHAQVHVRTGSTWTLESLPGIERFGRTVALDGRGERALGELSDTRIASVFARTAAGWVQEPIVPSVPWNGGAISADGTRVVLAVYNRVASFIRSGATWTEEAPLWSPALFGPWSIALSADGRRAVLGYAVSLVPTLPPSNRGAPGSARVYALEGNGWREELLLVPPLDGAIPATRSFGISVAMSADGKAVVVAPERLYDAAVTTRGTAFVFDLP
jgi:hypothetical protein